MEASQALTLALGGLPKIVGDILRVDCKLAPTPSAEFLEACPTVTHYQIGGGFAGGFAVFFPAAARRDWVAQFNRAVLKSETPPAGGDEQLCLEMANIILGHLTGLLGEAGGDLRISDPGIAFSGADFIRENRGWNEGGQLVALTRDDGGIHEPMAIWLSLAPGAGGAGRKPSVLIVDDSPAMTAFLEKIFVKNGYSIAGVAADGVEAIEKFEATNPDLVTLDIIMPKMKGTEVLERIMAKNPGAKVVMASSVSDARTVMQCLKIGAKRYIIKPYDEKAVLAAVEKALCLGK